MHNHDAAFVGPIQVFKESRHGITLKKAMIAEVDDAINSPDTPDTPDTPERQKNRGLQASSTRYDKVRGLQAS